MNFLFFLFLPSVAIALHLRLQHEFYFEPPAQTGMMARFARRSAAADAPLSLHAHVSPSFMSASSFLPSNRYEHFYSPIARPLTDLGSDIPQLIPDITNKSTVLNLAYAASNAYTQQPSASGWLDLDSLKANISFGWSSNGLRGHVFVDDLSELVVISYKGTSPNLFGIGGPSSERDKFNDNAMFSCCCAKVDATWKPICDCHRNQTQPGTCSLSCLRQTIDFADSYYNVARKVYNEVRVLYPRSQVWFVGHSLGGALSSLMALTTGHPAIAFQAPGDKLYAERMGFDLNPSKLQFQWQTTSDQIENDPEKDREEGTWTLAHLPIFHIGNNVDPIFTGKCTGPWSACYYSGYAMETKCHLGHRCVYELDIPKPDIRFHRIRDVIDSVLTPIEGVPPCKPVHYADDERSYGCKDCSQWTFT
jgi:lipase ATG15